MALLKKAHALNAAVFGLSASSVGYTIGRFARSTLAKLHDAAHTYMCVRVCEHELRQVAG